MMHIADVTRCVASLVPNQMLLYFAEYHHTEYVVYGCDKC